MLKVKGNRFGELEFVLEEANGKLIVSESDYEKRFNDDLLSDINKAINEKQRSIGGTYYPKPNTIMAAYLALQDGFFDDDNYKLELIDEPELPYEDNVVY